MENLACNLFVVVKIDLSGLKLASKLYAKIHRNVLEAFKEPLRFRVSLFNSETRERVWTCLNSLNLQPSMLESTKIEVEMFEDLLSPTFEYDFDAFLKTDNDIPQAMEWLEWGGLLFTDCIDVLKRTKVDPFISTCQPNPSFIRKNVLRIRSICNWNPLAILDLVESIPSSPSFICVKGNSRAPIISSQRPNISDDHGHTINGYALALNSSRNYTLFQMQNKL
jgi:hypothetical protein